MRESIRVVRKAPVMTGKRKVRFEGTSGDEYSKSLQKYVQKARHLDKDQNRYFEEVVDPDTGEVIRRCDEPLDQHRGHGSAKIKKNPAVSGD